MELSITDEISTTKGDLKGSEIKAIEKALLKEIREGNLDFLERTENSRDTKLYIIEVEGDKFQFINSKNSNVEKIFDEMQMKAKIREKFETKERHEAIRELEAIEEDYTLVYEKI